LILNAVALGVVMNSDEMLFKTLCQNLRKILARKFIPVKVKRVTGHES